MALDRLFIKAFDKRPAAVPAEAEVAALAAAEVPADSPAPAIASAPSPRTKQRGLKSRTKLVRRRDAANQAERRQPAAQAGAAKRVAPGRRVANSPAAEPDTSSNRSRPASGSERPRRRKATTLVQRKAGSRPDQKTIAAAITAPARAANPVASTAAQVAATEVAALAKAPAVAASREKHYRVDGPSGGPIPHSISIEIAPPVAAASARPVEPLPATPASAARLPMDSSPAEALRPLSSFQPRLASRPWIDPVWQVPRVEWPEVCNRWLGRAGEALQHLAGQLGNQSLRRVTLVSGCHRSEGRTTLSLCLARALATAGVSVALVDADFARPALAQRLGLAPTTSWVEQLSGEIPLEEALIESVEDRLTVLPLVAPVERGQALWQRHQVDAALAALRQRYEVVLVDSPPVSEFGPAEAATPTAWTQVDLALLVHDLRENRPTQLEAAARRVRSSGVSLWGVVENYA